jgi:hypothetical protein
MEHSGDRCRTVEGWLQMNAKVTMLHREQL